jgi:hypothetical protein
MRPSLHADQQWGVPTNILLLECLDVAGVAEEMGCADFDAALEDQLHAVRRSISLLISLNTSRSMRSAVQDEMW